MSKVQIVPFSAISACPHGILAPGHWNHYDQDHKCNCGRLCGYRDDFGGPCILATDGHPKDRKGALRHDDGQRNPANTSVWVR